ncbi:MAG: hypothetical protein EPN82_09725 [Bacteroidetes bacterium]|nr:MAG: hypothetical protein EPN82_09725 [Bacteroidota bacterium]
MKNTLIIYLFIVLSIQITQARIRYVDKNGGTDQFGHQKYQTIHAGIDAAIEGDTVRILPSIYNESITIGKNIVVQGGGLSTILTNDNGTVVSITSGKLMWVLVSGSTGNGIDASNCIISDCIISKCPLVGISINGPNCKIFNSISIGNSFDGFSGNANTSLINCIAVSNRRYGFVAWSNTMNCKNCDSYGQLYDTWNYWGNITKIDCLAEDPGFSSDGQYRISLQSKCKDSGDPTIFDLDGTRSDMGYYGGPDAPLLPYVTTPQNFILNPDGSMQFNLTGKVGY